MFDDQLEAALLLSNTLQYRKSTPHRTMTGMQKYVDCKYTSIHTSAVCINKLYDIILRLHTCFHMLDTSVNSKPFKPLSWESHNVTTSPGESNGIDLASARLSPPGLGVKPAAISGAQRSPIFVLIFELNRWEYPIK